ncbi:conjugal transfer protein TraE [Mycoplasmopsis arginini]|uniref:Conjugal transfer protein TraE n=1 Tax=Mycoplasmopsis arginini TaxID=2094 RepID=A0ABZ2AJQ6_MYCAR|nr:conjugal transfer protein TraE [Mycoplasmopsis arginini]WVN22260.1 conjugal transfer protein TraE [Mycoplasmopsis arginini]VEU81668.1 conjugal transfer ATPase TrbE [Mycoplasmopsis arginini]
MLQPKNLKKVQGKFWKNFTWLDYLVISILVMFAILIGYTALPESISKTIKFIVSIVLTLVFSMLLIKSKKYNCRVYVLFFRMIKFWFSVKKFSKTKTSPKNLIPYAELIENKFIKTKRLKSGTKFFSVIKFKGKSPWNEDDEDRESFLKKFTNLIDSTDIHLSLIRQKELIDYSQNFKSLEENANKKVNELIDKNAPVNVIENYQKYYEYINDDLNLLDTNLLVDIYYLVVYDKSVSELKKTIANATTFLNSMDIETNILENYEVISFLARLNNKELDLNLVQEYLEQIEENKREALIRNKDNFEYLTFKEKVKAFFAFLKSKLKLKKKVKLDKTNIKKPKLTLDSILANDKVIFKHNYFIRDNKFCSINTISELPLNLAEGWAIDLFDNNSTIVWNLGIFNEEIQATLLDKTSKKMVDNSNLVKSKYYQKAGGLQLEAIEYLENQLQLDKNVLTNSSLMIINSADSLKELRTIEAKIFANAKRNKITINPVPFRQFEAYSQACLITTNNLNEAIPMSSYNVAHGWPFENEENNDKNFFILGATASTGEPIIFDQFYKGSSRRVNYNMFSVGSSGKGKSTDVKKAVLGHLAQNNKVYIIDPQNEYSILGKKFGATIIDLGLGFNTVINPLEIQTQLFQDDEELSIKLIVNKHLEWVESFFRLINPDWTIDHIVLVMNFVRALYDKLGIYKLKTLDELKKIKYPIMSDLIKAIKNYKFIDEIEKNRKQETILRTYERLSFLFEYNGKYEHIYNGQTNLDLSNDFIIFNTQKLFDTGDGSGRVGLFVLLTFIQNKIFNNVIETPDKNSLLVIDELHMYIDPNNFTTLNFVYTMTKTVRKFNAGMILCTQNPSDFLGSSMITKKAEAILQNCQYSKFFGLKQKDLEAVNEMFKTSGGLNNSHLNFLADAEIGNLLFSLHMYSKIKSQIYYNDFEKELFFVKGHIGN